MTGVIGVGLLLFSNSHLLTVRELQSKPEYHKWAGMISFPLETYKERDGCPSGTIIRLLDEELGITEGEVEMWGISSEAFRLIPERTDVIIYYGVGSYLGDPKKDFKPKDTDVEIAGWKTPVQLLAENPIRIEVAPILFDFSTKNRESFT